MTTFHKTAETFQPGAQSLPQKYFTAPEIFLAEREKIFARQWLCLGHQSQLANPGDFFLAEAVGENFIVLRDYAGVVRGFYNLCRHRGARVCDQASGRLHETLQCPYHAWTYKLDGSLVGAPHMNLAADFRKENFALHAVALALWEGFIFINLADEPEPLAQALVPVGEKFRPWNIPHLRSAKRIVYDVAANWKLVFQNYSECYHCPLVHPTLAKLTPYDAGENDLYEGAFLGGFMPIAHSHSLTMSGNVCGLPVGDLKPEEHQRVYYYSLFPNLLLSLHPDYVMYHTVWPLAPDRVRLTCDWLFHPDSFAAPEFNPEDAIAFWDMTNRQDWHVCELSQQGITSRKYQPGPYSPRESIPAAFDREYLRALGQSKA